MFIEKQTTLTTIADWVYESFGLKIDKDTARQIKRASQNGSLLWSQQHLITTDESDLHITWGSAYEQAKAKRED